MPLPAANLAHESFHQPPNPGVRVWRYMDLSRLIAMLMRRELALTRMDLLPDKFEGYMGRKFRAALTKQAEDRLFKDVPAVEATTESSVPVKPRAQAVADFAKLLIANAQNWRDVAYVSCWRSGESESEAMWRLYCPAGTAGVAIVLPYDRLCDSLSDDRLHIGMVQYVDLDEQIVRWGNAMNALMCKRREFEHEHEVRVVRLAFEFSEFYQDGTMSLSRGAPDRPRYLSVPWNVEEHIQQIVVSPYSSPWHPELIADLLGKLAPALKSRVSPSRMGAEPEW